MQVEPLQDEQAVDAPTYRWVGIVLRAGLYISFAAMAVGLVWWFAGGGHQEAAPTVPLESILPELLAGNPLALLTLGVLVLLATPVSTLIAASVTYTAAGNRRFAGLTALVVGILLLSIALSLGWIRVF